MFNHLKGSFLYISPTSFAVECFGVGYALNISLYTYSKIKNLTEGLIFVHQVIKEDAHALYGFIDEAERELFRLLVSVSGVGPNTARMVQSSLSPQELYDVIAKNNVLELKKVKGLGDKTSQKIIIELKDKVLKLQLPTLSESINNSNTNFSEKENALSALISLGLPRMAADKALDRVLKLHTEKITLEEIIKLTLRAL